MEEIKKAFESEYENDLRKYRAWVHIGIDECCESPILSVMFPSMEILQQAKADVAFADEEYPADPKSKVQAIVQFAITPPEWRQHIPGK